MVKFEYRFYVDSGDMFIKMNGDFSFYGVSVFLFGIGNMDFVIKG